MKWLNLAGRVFTAACVGWIACVLIWIQQQPPVLPVGSQSYSAFTVDLNGEWITIRNAGGEVLTDCDIEFTAGLNMPGEATYHGKTHFVRWEPGEVQEIGIQTSHGPTTVRSVRFSGHASSPDKGWGIWRLAYQTEEEGR